MRKTLISIALSAGLIVCAAPSQAQYRGGLPYSTGTFYPLGGLLGSPFSSYARYGMFGSAASSTALWYGSYYGLGAVRSALFFGTTKLNGNHTSIFPEDYQKSNNITTGNGSYQEVHADWLPESQTSTAPGGYAYYPDAAPTTASIHHKPGPVDPSLLPSPSPMPAGSHETALKRSIPSPAHSIQNWPIASGFVDLVNNKFNGNISQALNDPEGNSWCHALGFKSNVHLSDAREKVIEGVLKDDTLDAVTKVRAVKALMHS